MATDRRKGISTKKVLDFIGAAPDAPKMTDEDGLPAPKPKPKKKEAQQKAPLREPVPAVPAQRSASVPDTWPYNVVAKSKKKDAAKPGPLAVLSLAMPQDLLSRLDAAAADEDQERNAFIVQLLELGLEER